MMGSVKMMLVEDSIEDRFFICRALRKVAPDSMAVEFSYVEDALTYLRSPERPKLDLIFVDINTPRMDGFEFADAYHALYPELKGDTQVYVISTSINPEDQKRAESHPAISGFLKKPISQDQIKSLID